VFDEAKPQALRLLGALPEERTMTARGAAPDVSAPRVRAARAADRERWNAFVYAQPQATFFHRHEWAEVLGHAFGHRDHYLVAERGDRVVGVLPLAEVRSRLFGHSLISTPFCVYGGIVAADDAAFAALERAAQDLAAELRVGYLEIRNRAKRHAGWPGKDLYVTFRKVILPDEEQNMLAIPRKQRAMVRKGIKAGLRSEIDAGVDRHYAIYSASLRNLGTPVFGRRYLEVLRETFGADCDVVTILNGAKPVASCLNFYFRDEVMPYYGGGTSQARTVAGNDFMYWEIMERARRRGCRVFDYGRSKLGTGAYDFKHNWGFVPEPLNYEYFMVRSGALPNLSPSNPKYGPAIGVWRRMPLGLTQLLGPPLAKHLG
jgi:FemAB-related protein (PEP-CTERM system-associated)